MFQVVLLLLAWAAAGALVNVAVAWGVLTYFNPGTGHMTILDQPQAQMRWQLFAPRTWPSDAIKGDRFKYGAKILETLEHADVQSQGSWTLYIRESGWPMMSFRGALLSRNGAVETRGLFRVRAVDSVPHIPIWPGFAINTLFYAAILWALFAAPFGLRGLRKRRRIKRGSCPNCAYDLRGRAPTSDVCPECGAPAPHAVKP